MTQVILWLPRSQRWNQLVNKSVVMAPSTAQCVHCNELVVEPSLGVWRLCHPGWRQWASSVVRRVETVLRGFCGYQGIVFSLM